MYFKLTKALLQINTIISYHSLFGFICRENIFSKKWTFIFKLRPYMWIFPILLLQRLAISANFWSPHPYSLCQATLDSFVLPESHIFCLQRSSLLPLFTWPPPTFLQNSGHVFFLLYHLLSWYAIIGHVFSTVAATLSQLAEFSLHSHPVLAASTDIDDSIGHTVLALLSAVIRLSICSFFVGCELPEARSLCVSVTVISLMPLRMPNT